MTTYPARWIRTTEPATDAEQERARQAREAERDNGDWLAVEKPKLIRAVHVSKSFAERWTNNPQAYKDYYNTENVEIQE